MLVFSLFGEVLHLFWTGHELQCVLFDTPDVKAQDLRLRVHYLLHPVKLLRWSVGVKIRDCISTACQRSCGKVIFSVVSVHRISYHTITITHDHDAFYLTMQGSPPPVQGKPLLYRAPA